MVVSLRSKYEEIKNGTYGKNPIVQAEAEKEEEKTKDLSNLLVNGFKPSKYQMDIFEFIANDTRSLSIEAVAGAAKTTTIVKSLELLNDYDEVLFCAFNKRIVDELGKRIPENVTVKTLNALGHWAWSGYIGGKVPLEEGKIRRLISEIMSDAVKSGDNEKANNLRRMRNEVKKGVDIARAIGVVPYANSELNVIIPSSKDVWDSIADEYGIDFDVPGKKDKKKEVDFDQEEYDLRWFAVLCEEVLEMCIEQHRKGIDFVDQLYLPVIFDVRTKKFDVVFIDEAQDVSNIQRCLLKKFSGKNGRLVAVGDSRQAIYGWRGADCSSMDMFAKEFECHKLPLSISYRCAKKIVVEAKKTVNHIEAHETAPEGVVKDLGYYESVKMFQPRDLILCRVNSFLIEMAYKMIREKVRFKYVGSNIQSGIVKLIKSFEVDYVASIPEKLEAWYEKSVAKKLKKNEDADLSALEDRKKTVEMIISMTDRKLVDDLIEELKYVFGDRDEDTCVILSSIHRAKGTEAERVYALNEWLIPSRFAKKKWQIEQENNLRYVMVTRAKKELYFIKTRPKN